MEWHDHNSCIRPIAVLNCFSFVSFHADNSENLASCARCLRDFKGVCSCIALTYPVFLQKAINVPIPPTSNDPVCLNLLEL
jgi:hypothetical protein